MYTISGETQTSTIGGVSKNVGAPTNCVYTGDVFPCHHKKGFAESTYFFSRILVEHQNVFPQCLLLFYEENMRALPVSFRRVFAIELHLLLEHRCHCGRQQDAVYKPRLSQENSY